MANASLFCGYLPGWLRWSLYRFHHASPPPVLHPTELLWFYLVDTYFSESDNEPKDEDIQSLMLPQTD